MENNIEELNNLENLSDKLVNHKEIQKDVEEFHTHELIELVEGKRFTERTRCDIYSDFASDCKVPLPELYSNAAKKSKELGDLKDHDEELDKRLEENKSKYLKLAIQN